MPLCERVGDERYAFDAELAARRPSVVRSKLGAIHGWDRHDVSPLQHNSRSRHQAGANFADAFKAFIISIFVQQEGPPWKTRSPMTPLFAPAQSGAFLSWRSALGHRHRWRRRFRLTTLQQGHRHPAGPRG